MFLAYNGRLNLSYSASEERACIEDVSAPVLLSSQRLVAQRVSVKDAVRSVEEQQRSINEMRCEARVAESGTDVQKAEKAVRSRVPVKDAVKLADDQAWDARREARDEEISNAVERAREVVRSIVDVEITRPMLRAAQQGAAMEADGSSMQERAQRTLIIEAAVASALKQGRASGDVVGPKEGEARLAASRAAAKGEDYDALVMHALRVLTCRSSMYVISINGYRTEGVDIVLSMSSLGASFQMRIRKGTTVAEVKKMIELEKQPAAIGLAVEVKLIGISGTLLAPSKTFPAVLDLEAQELPPDDEKGTFFPLSVLTGDAWREMGLEGVTRWKYLREAEFAEIFGMSKTEFEKLPSWKQVPLRRKHGLF
jgi:hypothetical protein